MHVRFFFMLLILPAVLVASGGATDPVRCPARVTRMKLERGSYSPQPGAEYDLRGFEAEMVARGKSAPLCFVRTTQIRSGEVFVSNESLTHMFQQKLAQKGDSKVSDVKIETRDDNTVHLSGKIKKKISMPFDIEGPVSTDGRNLILQAKKIDAGKLPIKWLLGMLGDNLAKMIGSETISGVVAKNNTLIFQPAQIAHVEGHIEKLQTTSKGLMITFTQVQQNANLRSGSQRGPD
jgi:hypothetical protein